MRNELAENFVEKIVADKYWDFIISFEEVANGIMTTGASVAVPSFTTDDVARAAMSGERRKARVVVIDATGSMNVTLNTNAPLVWSLADGYWHTGTMGVAVKLDVPFAMVQSGVGLVPSAVIDYAASSGPEYGAHIVWHVDTWNDFQ